MKIKVAIIGAGVAGLTCGIWLKRFQVDVKIYEATAGIGGLLKKNPYPYDWVPGLYGLSGEGYLEKIQQQIFHEGLTIETDAPIGDLAKVRDSFVINRLTRRELFSHLVVATGCVPAREPLENQVQNKGKIITGPLELSRASISHEDELVFLGGGDNAFENAIAYAGKVSSVSILARKEFRARPDYMESAKQLGIRLLSHTVIRSIQDSGESTVSILTDGELLIASKVVVMYGYSANIPWVGGALAGMDMADNGCILTDSFRRTNFKNIYAIGDVADAPYRSVLQSMNDGAVAAKSIANSLR